MANFSVVPDSALGNVNVIPFPQRGADQGQEFLIRFHAARLARARYELSQEECAAARALGTAEDVDSCRKTYWYLFENFVAAVDNLAAFPAMTRRQLRGKEIAIGTIWLRAEGDRYDRYRAAIVADEARLDVVEPKRGRKRGAGAVT